MFTTLMRPGAVLGPALAALVLCACAGYPYGGKDGNDGRRPAREVVKDTMTADARIHGSGDFHAG